MNINADVAARELAIALKPMKVVFISAGGGWKEGTFVLNYAQCVTVSCLPSSITAREWVTGIRILGCSITTTTTLCTRVVSEVSVDSFVH